MSLRAGSATLLYVYMDVQPVGLGRGYYTVDMRFFYKITAEATAGCAKCAPITGLAIFDKRSILFGSEGRSKHFTSENSCQKLDCPVLPCDANLPTAICEAVDPLILSMRLVDCCAPPLCCCEIPVSVSLPGFCLPLTRKLLSRTIQPNGFTAPWASSLSCTWSGTLSC